MRRSIRSKIIRTAGLSLAAAAVVTAGIWFGHTRMESLKGRIGELSAAVEEQKRKMSKVICIGRDHAAGEAVDAADIYVAEVPSEALPADCLVSAAEAEGRILRIPLLKGAYITSGMLIGEAPTDDVRELRYGCIRTDAKIAPGDCVDVRIRYADGTDYVVMAKKSVFDVNEQGLLLRVDAEEILLMDGAAVDASLFDGTYIYAAAYVEDMIQEAAKVNYTPAAAVIELIEKDPNVVRKAERFLSMDIRKSIEGRLYKDADN